MTRYVVVPPVDGPDGYHWWRVVDQESSIMPNFPLAEFWRGLEDAQGWAERLCATLNSSNKPKGESR